MDKIGHTHSHGGHNPTLIRKAKKIKVSNVREGEVNRTNNLQHLETVEQHECCGEHL